MAKYPGDEVKTRAEEILSLLSKYRNASGADSSDSIVSNKTELYNFDKDEIHYYILVVPDEGSNINQLKMQVANYNSKFFRMGNLKIDNRLLGTKSQLIIVKKFKGVIKAFDYYDAIQENATVFAGLKPGTFQQFLISASNYLIFSREKNIPDYVTFFSQNYRND